MNLRRNGSTLRKRTVDRVIEECFWNGFWDGLCGSDWGGLEYASTSGLYEYNGVRRIAERAGHKLATQIIDAHVNPGEKPLFGGWRFKRDIPGSVYAECYGEARLAVK